MSTRSIIAVPDHDHGWVGVYHHSDGYPTGMGVYLTRIFDALGGDVARFRKLIIEDHPAGWSLLSDGRCYCHWQGREEEPALFYGDETLESDAEWFYLVTPDGIVTRKVTWREQNIPIGHPDYVPFLADMGPSFTDLADAVRWYAHDRCREPEQVIRSFMAGEGWAFEYALPDFCLPVAA